MHLLKDTKTRVVEASVALFARKGFRSSTISDLAREAGLGEATIYNHFKNKEEVLLSILPHCMPDFFAGHEEQLQGIRNPEEKLRKFIWQYLWWSQRNPDMARVLILDILPYPNYYHSESYEIMRAVGRIPATILEEGQAAGVFRPPADPTGFRYFVMGTIHYLYLSRFLFDRPFDVIDDFDELAGAMVASVRQEESPASVVIGDVEEKKQRIFLAAESLFSSKLFSDATISEIARLANVADGTIYEYFANKEDLLFSIFEKRMEDFSAKFDQTLRPEHPAWKLRHVLWHFLSWAQNNRPWTRVYFKDLIPNPRFYESRQHEFMRDHDAKLVRIYEEGQVRGVFRADLKVHLFRAMIFGTMDHICSPWAMLGRDDDLVGMLDGFYELVYRAVKA